MANDVADWTSSVVIQSGSVTIAGTATVTISGTPTVSISGIPAVSISGVPAVTINSGSVTAVISGTPNINIQSQAVTLAINQPQVALANLAFPGGGSTQTTAAVPAGTHALQLVFIGSFSDFSVKGHSTGAVYYPVDVAGISGPTFPPSSTQTVVIPINSANDTQYDCVATTAGAATVVVTAILDSQAVWVQNDRATPIFIVDEGSISSSGGYVKAAQIAQPYDWSVFHVASAAVTLSRTVGAQAGKRIVLENFDLSLVSNGGAFLVHVRVWDGATGTTQIADYWLNVPASLGAHDRVHKEGLHLAGTIGNALTIDADAASPANVGLVLNAGGYQRAF